LLIPLKTLTVESRCAPYWTNSAYTICVSGMMSFIAKHLGAQRITLQHGWRNEHLWNYNRMNWIGGG